MRLNSHPSGRHFLQIPGPTNVPDRILRAMDYPTIDHRDALRARGLTPFHRHDFGTVKLLRAVENQLSLALSDTSS